MAELLNVRTATLVPVICFGLFALAGCSGPVEDKKYEPVPMKKNVPAAPPKAGMEVPRGPRKDCYTGACLTVSQLSLMAHAGDIKAARELADIYSVYGAVDEEKWLYWETIGAENGSVVAQYNLASLLLNEMSNKVPDSKVRAMFWLRKAAAKGDEDAKGLLTEVLQEQK